MMISPRDMQLIPGFLNAALENKHRFQVGPNKTLFDYTYVENVAWAHICAMQNQGTTAWGKVQQTLTVALYSQETLLNLLTIVFRPSI